MVIILLATVTSVLWKAAKSNPVEALKCRVTKATKNHEAHNEFLVVIVVQT